MKKKILFISEALWIGGIETALVNLLNRMDYEKYDVTCLVVRGSLEIADRITHRCRLIVADREKVFTFSKPYPYSRLYHLTEDAVNPSGLHRAMMWTVPAIRWIENRLYIRYIREQMKGEQFDTCVIYSDRTAEIAVRGICADKYLMFYHHGAMRRAYHDEIGYRKSKKVITVSEKTLNMLKAFRPKYADKITAIHNILDIESVINKSRESPSLTFPKGQFNLVSCGRLTEAKGIDWAIQTMRMLLDRSYADLHWWIVGGGPDEHVLKKLAADARICEHFHLLGMQSNPYPYIAACDLYVQPSLLEGKAVTVREAQMLGKPVVITRYATSASQLEEDVDGVIVPMDNEGCAAGIAELLQDEAKMERLRQTCLSRDYSGAEEVEKIYQLME